MQPTFSPPVDTVGLFFDKVQAHEANLFVADSTMLHLDTTVQPHHRAKDPFDA